MLKNNIGISIGTDTTYIYIQKDDKIISFETIVAIDSSINEIIEVGKNAIILSEKGPKNIYLKRPIKEGKIEDIELVQKMLNIIFKKYKIRSIIANPNVLISYDNHLNEVEKNAIVDVIREIGVNNIYTIDSLKSIALGIGMDITKPVGNMIIDIGYELTRIGVISMNSIIEYRYVNIGSNSFNNNIIDYLRKKYKLLISYNEVEELKTNIEKNNLILKGKNIITGLPKSITINNNEIMNSLNNNINKIIEEVKLVLEQVSPEIFSDISNKGIVITGGGSMLSGLREKIEKEIMIPILETTNARENVIKGIKKIINTDISQANKI